MIKRVQEAFAKFAPTSLAGSWDNTGILLEAPFTNPGASKVFLTIDLTLSVLEEALSHQDLAVIVAYHPFLFSSFKRITMQDEKQKIALICAAKGISVYSPHTAVDSCLGGINDWLAKGLGKSVTTVPITASPSPPAGQEGSGVGRMVTLAEPVSLDEVTSRIKKHLNLEHVRRSSSALFSSSKSPLIKRIAICAGSGSSVLNGVEADLFLSGEMGHHDVLSSVARGTNVILTEHSNSERGYLQAVLKPTLEALLNADCDQQPRVQVVVSSVDADPLLVV